MVSHFRHVDLGTPRERGVGAHVYAHKRTGAAMPLSVSVRDGYVSAPAGFARLADSSTARIGRPLLASPGAEHDSRRQGK